MTRATEEVATTLARPFGVRGLVVPNRIVMAPMTRRRSPGGVPGEDVAAYYARRAGARVGLIISEATLIGHPSAGRDDRVPGIYEDRHLEGWARVVRAVHAAGGKIVAQLWHVGMVRKPGEPPFPGAAPVGPSGVGLDGSQGGGRTMTLEDIDDVVRAFAQAAVAAERIGFDGAEVHGAHGYLIDQFLWSRTNRRTDRYGGDLLSRTRFAAEIVAAIRGSVTAEFPVFLRLSQWKASDYEARLAEGPAELQALLVPLAEAGVDAFHASTRRYWQPEFPDSGSGLNLAGWARRLTGKAAVTVGSVGLADEFLGQRHASSRVEGLDDLVERLHRDEFDLVAVGRALLADPEWAQKVLDGRTAELTPYSTTALSSLY